MTAKLKDLAKKARITVKYGAKGPADDTWRQQANGYRCTLHYKGRQYSFDFWMGPALSEEPDAQSTLDCLLSDASSGDYSFEEFCNEFGYDIDSRKAEQTWKQCQKTTKAMRRLLGDDYEMFLRADRN